MAKRIREESEYDLLFEELKIINVPLLTLDKDWHNLFMEGKPREIEKLEKELNETLKSRGKINADREELERLKKTLLKQIVENMDAGENSRASKKVEKSRQLIEDINDKLILLEDKELDKPDEIRESNARLMMASMDELCSKSMENAQEIEELDGLIENARLELKKKILLRQQKQEENDMINKYLNKTVGREFVRRYEEYLKS